MRDLLRGFEARTHQHENARVYGEVNQPLADAFCDWVETECDPPTTPTEWYEAWQEYVNQYEDDDGEPYDIDDDSHYDPYTGGSDFMREHGEDCYGIDDDIPF